MFALQAFLQTKIRFVYKFHRFHFLRFSFICFLQYNEHEEIVLWMNTVGPYDNRQETYAYFSLPFCQGERKTINHYHETMSEALQGVELEYSGYPIDFKGKCNKIVKEKNA